MAFEHIIYEVEGHIATITLNRPERLNAFNKKMTDELGEAWTTVKRDPEIRCVIVTGAGDRALSTGADVKGYMEEGDFDIAREPRSGSSATPDFLTLTAIQNGCWKPVITAVNGMVCGGGLHFIADSDITIAADSATFFDTHVAVGKVSGLESVGLLRRIPFEAVARLALLGGSERMSADEAKAVGLISEVVPAADLMARARKLAGYIASHSPVSVARTKQAMWESLDLGLEEGLSNAWNIIREHNVHPDNEEGPRARYEKRSPQWEPFSQP